MRKMLRRFIGEERAAVLAEFAIAFPLFFTFFVGSLELTYMLVRTTMFERSLDLIVRDLRLGSFGTRPNIDVLFLEDQFCSRTTLFPDCQESITLELTQIDQTTWAMPGPRTPCARRDPDLRAGRDGETVNVGNENELVLIRACMVVESITPLDSLVDYTLVASSVFVNEPN